MSFFLRLKFNQFKKICFVKILQVQSIHFNSRKRISTFISIVCNILYSLTFGMQKQNKYSRVAEKGREHRRYDGSVTLEAALVFPIFIYVLYMALAFSQLLITNDEIARSVNQTARYMAKLAYTLQSDDEYNAQSADKKTVESKVDEQKTLGIANKAIDSIVAKQKFLSYVDDAKLVNVKNHSAGVSFIKSEGINDNREIVLVAQYIYIMKIPVFGKFSFPMEERAVQKAFLGYDEKNDFNCGEYVYVAETGSVYHSNLNCSHIAIKVIPSKEAAHSHYRVCQRCGKGRKKSGTYVTVSGDCIHYDSNCSGLKRTIHLVRKDQLGHLPLCQRCSGK